MGVVKVVKVIYGVGYGVPAVKGVEGLVYLVVVIWHPKGKGAPPAIE